MSNQKCVHHDKESCGKNARYGNYCYKHRNLHLCDKNNIIIEGNFTNISKDYTLLMLNNYIKHYRLSKENIKNDKKSRFSYIQKIINDKLYYLQNINHIITLQIREKYKQKKKITHLRGPGYYNRNTCNNDEDFYFYTPINDIDNIYFFSYNDDNNNIWYFDIRSIKKLIEHNHNNPYTTLIIPDYVKNNVNELIQYLKNMDINIQIEDTTQLTRTQQIKQNCVDIFGDIQQMGYECNIDWFLKLSLSKIKRLYKELEDIWNYRAQLNPIIKSRMSPPNGNIFTVPISDIYTYTDKQAIQGIILNDIKTFQNAELESDKKLGYMYFLMGLSQLSTNCLLCHPWIYYSL
jgi:hypothetical protein